MKNQYLLNWMLIMALSVLVTACSSSKDSQLVLKSAGGSATSSGGSSSSQQNLDSKSFLGCAQQEAAVGRLIDPNYNSSSADAVFTQRVKDFASSFMDPSKIGQLSGAPTAMTGIEVEGVLSFDKAGKLDLKTARVQLEIFDDRVGTLSSSGKVIKQIPVYLATAKSGQWNASTGQFEVVFEDEFGQVVLRGVIGKSSTSAEVRFVNKLSYNNGTPKSGVLGTFYIYSCGFIY